MEDWTVLRFCLRDCSHLPARRETLRSLPVVTTAKQLSFDLETLQLILAIGRNPLP